MSSHIKQNRSITSLSQTQWSLTYKDIDPLYTPNQTLTNIKDLCPKSFCYYLPLSYFLHIQVLHLLYVILDKQVCIYTKKKFSIKIYFLYV